MKMTGKRNRTIIETVDGTLRGEDRLLRVGVDWRLLFLYKGDHVQAGRILPVEASFDLESKTFLAVVEKAI